MNEKDDSFREMSDSIVPGAWPEDGDGLETIDLDRDDLDEID